MDSARRIAGGLEIFSGLQDLAVAGFSYGGPVAACLAALMPAKVHLLLLLSPSAEPGAEKRFWFNGLLSRKIMRGLISHAWHYANEEKRSHAAELRRIEDVWGIISCRTVCKYGGRDRLIYPSNAAFIAQRLAGKDLFSAICIEGAGHDIIKKHPKEIIKVLSLG